MSIWGKLAGIGGIAAAPFTGGTSLSWVPAALGGASAADAMFSGGGKQSATGASGLPEKLGGYADMLGGEGKKLLGSGQQAVDRSTGLFNPLLERNERLLSGDSAALRAELAPETDAIGQQFQNVRNMISDQPRGGGKASTVAQLPIEEMKMLAKLMSEERTAAAGQQGDLAGKLLGAGERERALGFEGLAQGGQMLLGKGGQDVAKRGQNIDLGSKIAETVAELAFLLKGSGGGGKTGGANEQLSF